MALISKCVARRRELRRDASRLCSVEGWELVRTCGYDSAVGRWYLKPWFLTRKAHISFTSSTGDFNESECRVNCIHQSHQPRPVDQNHKTTKPQSEHKQKPISKFTPRIPKYISSKWKVLTLTFQNSFRWFLHLIGGVMSQANEWILQSYSTPKKQTKEHKRVVSFLTSLHLSTLGINNLSENHQ